MPSKLEASKQYKLLEKTIRSKAYETNQQHIAEYMNLRFKNVLRSLLNAQDEKDIIRFTGELAVLRDMIEITSNSTLDILQGDKHE